MPKRREFPAKVKVAAFERAKGCCEECTAKLAPGNVHYDHRIPDAVGGEPTLDNCQCLCTACHRIKTSGEDMPRIVKTRRQHRQHIGAKAPSRQPLPGGRGDKFKRKLDGTVVLRDSE